MTTEIKFSAIVGWLVPYILSVGVLYQYSFWGHFDVPILAYLDIDDVLRLSTVPIVFLLFCAVLVGLGYKVVVSVVALFRPENTTRDSEIKSTTRAVSWISKVTFLAKSLAIMTVFFTVTIVWTVWNLPLSLSSAVLLFIIASFAGVTARSAWWSMLMLPIPNKLTATFVCGTPALVIYMASVNASGPLLRVGSYVEASVTLSESQTASQRLPDGLVYVGHAGDHDFFRANGVTFVVASSNILKIELRRKRERARMLRVPFVDPPEPNEANLPR